jgi:Mrp family chromosome partitioning ATPase
MGAPAFEASSIDLAPGPAIDAVRYLLASLQHRDDAGALPSRLAFTSVLAGEGVSFVSRAVASVLAHDSQSSVCVVELDWHGAAAGGVPRKARRRRARLGGDGAERRPGLAEVVRREVGLRDVVVGTEDPRLTTVAAGNASPAEGEVLARSPRLRHLIGVLERHNDHVVLALPPVLVSSAAIALAREAHAVGLVVRHGVTTEAQVRTAIERLGQIPFAGVVLNRASSDIPRPLLRRLSNW